MRTPARIVRFVGITGLVCWLGMIGWLAKTSRAQNGVQAPPPAPSAVRPDTAGKVDLSLPPPIAPAEAPKPAPTRVPPLSPDKQHAPPEPTHHEGLAPPPIEPQPPAQARSQAPEPAVPPLPAAEANPVAATEDPELSAQTFVERNQKEAEERLKALTAEAEQLRTRLNKLQSGVKKWENLVNALRMAKQGPVTATAVTAGAEDAGDLEPIRPGTPGGARGEKRVKWSTAAGSGNATAAATSAQPPAEEAEPAGPAAAPPPAQVPVARPAQATAPAVVPR